MSEQHSPSVLDMSPADFRQAGYRVVDALADFLDSLESRPVAPPETRDEIDRLFGRPDDESLPEAGTSAADLLLESVSLVASLSRLNGHPRFWGQIVSPGAPAAALCDLIASVINPNVALWSGSPIGASIERQALCWIADLIGYPSNCGGIFVSGGTMANIVGLCVARHELSKSSGAGRHDLRLYASESTHLWIEKACTICGIDPSQVEFLAVDEHRRMSVEAFAAAAARDTAEESGVRGILVATAGEVMTGAVDRLGELIRIARRFGMWVHVDGAYGAPAACVAETGDDLSAIGEADSLAIDAHKWLYAPLEAGCVLVRDQTRLRSTFDQSPNYADRSESYNEPMLDFFRLGPQTSRGFRALKVWFLLRHLGRAGYEGHIRRDIEAARSLYEAVSRHPSLEPHSRHLSITTFRYVPDDLDPLEENNAAYLNHLNREILAAIQDSGDIYLSNAYCDSKYLLRACFINFRTRRSDIDAIPVLTVRQGRRIHNASRNHRR